MCFVLASSTGGRELLNYYSLKHTGPEYWMYGSVSTNDFIRYTKICYYVVILLCYSIDYII